MSWHDDGGRAPISILKNFGVMQWLATLIFMSGMAYYTLKSTTGDVKAQAVELRNVAVEVATHATRIAVLETDIKYIREGVKELLGDSRRSRRDRWPPQ